MKLIRFIVINVFVLGLCIAQEGENGFRGYEVIPEEVEVPFDFHSWLFRLEKGDKVKWVEFDVNGDGLSEIMICSVDDFLEDQKTEAPNQWDTYIKKGNGKYIPDKSTGGLLSFNPSMLYVGKIDELQDKYGVVTVRVDNPREGGPVAHILAYIFDDDGKVIKHELANFPAEQDNAIFDKYLSEEKRTKVVVEEKIQ